ncbi:MAG: type VI secretion system-associated protein TagF [bacterium]|nr:type VI secretion system-associated protein TagF [bacterium]
MTNNATIGCLGKLPLHGDFVRVNHAHCPGLVAIDRWLLDGMERSYAERGKAFEAELRALPPLRVLVSDGAGQLFDGLILPSADQVGRVYPFVAGWQLPTPPAGPEFDRLPLVGRTSFDSIVALVLEAAETRPALAEFQARFQALAFVADHNEAEQALRGFTFATTVEALFRSWPGGEAPARRERALAEFWRVGQPPFPPRYLTTIPYAGEPAEAAFWLTFLRQCLAVCANPTAVIWPATAGGAGSIRLLFDRLDSRYFGPALWPEQHAGAILDLGRELGGHKIAPATEGFATPLPARGLLQDVILAAGRLPR